MYFNTSVLSFFLAAFVVQVVYAMFPRPFVSKQKGATTRLGNQCISKYFGDKYSFTVFCKYNNVTDNPQKRLSFFILTEISFF